MVPNGLQGRAPPYLLCRPVATDTDWMCVLCVFVLDARATVRLPQIKHGVIPLH